MNQTIDGRTAAALYSGCFILLAVIWSSIWSYSRARGLIAGGRRSPLYFVGPISYAIAFGLAFVSGFASLIVIILVAIYFTIGATEVWRLKQTATLAQRSVETDR